MSKSKSSNDDAPVWGAEAIGRVIGRSEAATYHLIYSGHLGDAVKKSRWSILRAPRAAGPKRERSELARPPPREGPLEAERLGAHGDVIRDPISSKEEIGQGADKAGA